jgi:hypothetical protein
VPLVIKSSTITVLGALNHEYSLLELLKRPKVNYQILSQIESAQPFLTDTTLISVVENQINTFQNIGIKFK